jgi:hypothetical protein
VACCRVMLTMVLLRRRYPWCDVTTVSCWRWRYPGDIGAMSLSGHAGDDAAEATLVVT